MTKKELIADMKATAGSSFVPKWWLAGYMHLKDPRSVNLYLQGLPQLNGRYFIGDIAERLLIYMRYRG